MVDACIAIVLGSGWLVSFELYRWLRAARTERDSTRDQLAVTQAHLTRTRDALARCAAASLAVPELMAEREAMILELQARNREAN